LSANHHSGVGILSVGAAAMGKNLPDPVRLLDNRPGVAAPSVRRRRHAR
jgi:hypothetical protein